LKYKEIIQLREAIGYRYTQINAAGLTKNTSFTELINGITGVNKFITIFDYQKSEIVFHHQVKEYLGFENEEFTIPAINNADDTPYKVIHPEDLEHKLRYDYIVLFHLMNNADEIPTLKDSYEITMRIVAKDGSIKRVNRQSYFYETNEDGYPISQLDVWKIVPNDSPYVTVSLNYSSKEDKLNQFYKQNRELLGFDISARQIEILKLRNQRFDNKSIAEELQISSKTVENHIHNLKAKMQDYYLEKGINESIYNMNDMIHFIKKYNIFPFTIS